MVDQGLSFTILDAAAPLDGDAAMYDNREQFRSAHRLWLGWTGGSDWLREGIEAEYGEDIVWYEVRSFREETYLHGVTSWYGLVVLGLVGAGALDFLRTFYVAFAKRLGEQSADVVLDWVRERAKKRRKEKLLQWTLGAPNFFDRGLDELAEGMRGELADALRISGSRLDLLGATRDGDLAMRAAYRDRETGREYEVIVGEDWATFRRL